MILAASTVFVYVAAFQAAGGKNAAAKPSAATKATAPHARSAATLRNSAEAARAANSPEAPALYRQALAANPSWQEGWWALGTLEYARDHFPECRTAFRSLVALASKSGPALTMLGLCEAGAQENDQALVHLRAGQELGAGAAGIDKVAKFQLARLLTQAGLFESALGMIVKLAQTAPDNPAYYSLAGVAALWKPIVPEAVPAADRELVYLAGRAFWYAASGKAAEAAQAVQDLLAAYPDAPGVHYLSGSLKLRDSAEQAVAEFEAELKLNPGHAGALAALTAEYLREGEAAKALPYARRLVEALPNALASHALLGRILAEQGETEAAVSELEKARAIDPDHPQPHIALAALYAKLGRKEDAARERREFLRVKDRGEQ